MRLREELDVEIALAEQLLNLIRHFTDRVRIHKPEIIRVGSLSNHPLIDYDMQTLERMTGADMSRVCGNSHGLIRKYGLMCCRQCFHSNAKEIGFIKDLSVTDFVKKIDIC
ncbi:Ribosomal protein S14 [Artemisia annua]|uniref:Ribosomal protein S14 n=1 Tax=Artemisia annua TaxID=35608 RepID=A0A2U1NNT7_ARTAN|nr:Ribosomal protein S14 [Artemisia annua]